MIVVNMSFGAKAGRTEAFRQALIDMMHATVVEDGCILYRYTRDLEDPQLFHLVELWESEAQMQAHIDAPHSMRFVAQLPELADFKAVRADAGDMRKFRIPAPKG